MCVDPGKSVGVVGWGTGLRADFPSFPEVEGVAIDGGECSVHADDFIEEDAPGLSLSIPVAKAVAFGGWAEF